MAQQHVLVTGGSGFIAGHIILQLLEQGHLVRTTVRSLQREPEVRAVLVDAGMVGGDSLTFVEADLTIDAGWTAAVSGCDFVLHVASPVQPGKVKHENAVIVPAREGTMRVLRAARDAGVKRVVLTSAFHAVGFGHPHSDHVFTEDDWSVLDGPGVDAYGKSKILAERAAWDFVNGEGNRLELVTILPVAVLGPVMGKEVSGANHMVQRSLNGQMPGYPNMYIPIVDVRDVANAHVSAMTAPGAAGERFLVASGEPRVAMLQIGAILKSTSVQRLRRCRPAPSRTVWCGSPHSSPRNFRPVAADLGFVKQVSNEKARRVLGLQPRASAEEIIASAESLIAKSLV